MRFIILCPFTCFILKIQEFMAKGVYRRVLRSLVVKLPITEKKKKRKNERKRRGWQRG